MYPAVSKDFVKALRVPTCEGKMLEAALAAGRSPRQLIFAAALQKIAASWVSILVCDEPRALTVIEVHLKDMATHQVGDRPNRVEPRAVKRCPKPHKLLMQPRSQAHCASATPSVRLASVL